MTADPIAIVFAARAGEVEASVEGLTHIELTGLDLDSARELLRANTTTPVTDEQVTRLHAATAGNPLAMLELSHDLDALDHTGPDIPLPLPERIARSFTRRVRSLDAAARSVLLVAVISNGEQRLTSAVCERLQLDPAKLVDAQRAALVSMSGGQVRFRHPLLRAAVYADATAAERAAVHQAAAAVLPDHQVDRRAWHLAESTWSPDPAVASLLTSAAEHAASRTAYAVASTAYERAAQLSPDHDGRARRLLKAADTAWSAGLGPRAIGLLDELRKTASGESVVALTLRAAIEARTGRLVEARDMLERAAAQTSSADLTVALLADAVHESFYLADTAGALRLADQLVHPLDAASSTQARAVGMMAIGLAKVLTGESGAEEIRSAVPLLAASAELHTDHRRIMWLMLAPLFLRVAGFGAELRAVVDDVRSRAGIGTLPSLLFLVARDQATTDAWARAEANYAEAIRLARDTGQNTELAVSLAGLAWLESRQGQADKCRTHAAEALPICADRQINLGQAWVLFALGDLELSLGDPRAATDHLQRLQRLLAELGFGDPDLSPGPELADALLRSGRTGEARRVAATYQSAANAKGQPWARARAERAMGLLAPDDELDRRFKQALELHEQTLDSFETGRTRLAYGVRLRRAGRRIDARPQLRAAMTVFTALGAVQWSDAAAAELDATGEKVTRRSPAGVAALTPQELQVSLLLAEGRTTREAAAALFLSPKTVEYHLRKVYTKFGIRSRAELSSRLSAEGMLTP